MSSHESNMALLQCRTTARTSTHFPTLRFSRASAAASVLGSASSAAGAASARRQNGRKERESFTRRVDVRVGAKKHKTASENRFMSSKVPERRGLCLSRTTSTTRPSKLYRTGHEIVHRVPSEEAAAGKTVNANIANRSKGSDEAAVLHEGTYCGKSETTKRLEKQGLDN